MSIAEETVEQNHQEVKIKNGDETYRILVSEINDGIFITNSEGIITFANMAFARIFGYESPDEVVGKNPLEFIPTDFSSDTTIDIMDAKTRENFMQVVETPITRKNGSTGWVELKPTFIIENGKISGTRGILRDITERKKAEETLREEKGFLARIFASIQDGISILDKDMQIRAVNTAMERWYAHAMPLVGKKCFDAYHGRDRECEACPTRRTLETGKVAVEIVPKTGVGGKVKGWLELFSFPLIDTNSGEMQGVIEFVRDITDRKRAEDGLRLSEEKFRTLAENCPLGIFQTDKNGNTIYANDAVSDIAGIKKEKCLGTGWLDLVHPSDKPFLMKNLVFTTKKDHKFQGEFRIVRPSGDIRWVRARASSICDRDGDMAGKVGTIADITDRKRVEESLRDSELRFRLAANSVTDLIWDWDIKSGRLEWYGNVDDVLGYEAGTFPRTIKAWEEIIHPDDRHRVMKALDLHLQKGIPYREEYRVIRKDESQRYWLDTGTALWDEEGKAYKMVGACSDSTERVLAEEKVKRQTDILDAVNVVLQETLFCEKDDDVAHVCLEVAQALTRSDFGFIGEVESDGTFKGLDFAAFDVSPLRVPDHTAKMMLNALKERGIWAIVINKGKPFQANDMAPYLANIIKSDKHPPFKGFLAVPLKYAGKTCGLLAVAKRESGYDVADQEALESITVVFVEAIQRKRLQSRLEQDATRLETKKKMHNSRKKKEK